MATAQKARPDLDTYFMQIALAVRARADCTGNRVGSIIVRDKHIVATGYNGTPAGLPNCSEGGCPRCAEPDKYASGTGYEACNCLHSEANCLHSAAKFGISVRGGTLYSTMRPCVQCTKALLQTEINTVYYLHDWQHPDPDTQKHYETLQEGFPGGIHKIDLRDPDEQWAVRSKRNKKTSKSLHLQNPKSARVEQRFSPGTHLLLRFITAGTRFHRGKPH